MWQQTWLFSSVAPLLTSTDGLVRALPPIGAKLGGLPYIPPSGATTPPRARVYRPLTPALAGVLPVIAFLKWMTTCGPVLPC